MARENKKINHQIDINKLGDFDIPQALIKKAVLQVLIKLKIKRAEISIVFTNPKEIKRLNKIYRRRDSVTDVLSFSYYCKKGFLSGEIIVCWPLIKKNAIKSKVALNMELKKVLIHSLLHLVGYDHKKKSEFLKMKKMEGKLLNLK